jgi:glucose-6-phosphate isomerase
VSSGIKDRIILDVSRAFPPAGGISSEDLQALAPALDAARGSLVAEAESPGAGRSPVTNRGPAGIAFLELPDRMLEHYHENSGSSELGRMLNRSHRLREQVDRVAVLGLDGSHLAAQALMHACCDPHFNELSRGDRGSRPRIYFNDRCLDNDSVQGLLKLLRAGRPASRLEDRWALMPIGGSVSASGAAGALHPLLVALRAACGEDPRQLADLVIPIGSGPLSDFADSLGCAERFGIPGGLTPSCSAFSAAGLLPLAILGVNVVRLLEGAVAMNETFRTAPPLENPVLSLAGTSQLWLGRRGERPRVLSIWSEALEAVGQWYDHLLAESFGGFVPGGRARRSFGRRPHTSPLGAEIPAGLTIDWVVGQCRTDPIELGPAVTLWEKTHLPKAATLPGTLATAIAATQQARFAAGEPAVAVRLPDSREYALGQLLQLLMLATALERRMMMSLADR